MNVALILSGGTGSRMGTEIPKQYLQVHGKTILSYVLDVFEKHPLIDKIWIVAADEWRTEISGYTGKKFCGFSNPGINRQMSIYNGLKDFAGFVADNDKVIIHDAARPLISAKMITEIIDALKEHEAVIPVLPMKDTVYKVEDGKIASLLERSKIVAGQAPEGFLFGRYLKANEKLLPEKILEVNGSTEVAYLDGMTIKCIPGDEMNFKITTPADLEKFKKQVFSKTV